MRVNAKKPSSKVLQPGAVFLVRLVDGTHGVGQVLKVTKEAMNSVLCAFFDIRLEGDAGDAMLALDTTRLDATHLVSVQFVTPDLLKKRTWPIVAERAPAVAIEDYVPLQALERNGFVGAKIVGSGNIGEFLSAYHALCPWDEWADPHYLDKLLVSPDKRPSNVILTKS